MIAVYAVFHMIVNEERGSEDVGGEKSYFAHPHCGNPIPIVNPPYCIFVRTQFARISHTCGVCKLPMWKESKSVGGPPVASPPTTEEMMKAVMDEMARRGKG